MRARIPIGILVGAVAFAACTAAIAASTLAVGSKRFTESYILGEIIKQSAQAAGEATATHSQGLGNTAIAGKQVDAIDIYSTDAKIDKYGLTVLDDDRSYFPRYDAVLLYRADLPQRSPKTWSALKQLEGRIDDATMRKMNAAAELEGKDFATIAASFLAQRPGASAAVASAA